MTRTQQQPRDIYVSVTQSLIEAIEAKPGEWTVPWRQSSEGLRLPLNAASKRPYHGINTVVLWVTAQRQAYASPLWGTYKQWTELGAQVRKGEKGTLIVFYKTFQADPAPDDPDDAGTRCTVRSFIVFNASQVKGFAAPQPEAVPSTLFERVEAAETFAEATGASFIYGGDRALYRRTTDVIHLPEQKCFTGSATMTAAEAYAATKLHELTHWTGSPHRLAREFGKRFGDAAYAFEELVAEIATSMLMAELSITADLRPDHAQYLAHWLAILKSDKRAIFTAAAKAQQAVEFLKAFQTPAQQTHPIAAAA
jgi:antirestriction protein ArdC